MTNFSIEIHDQEPFERALRRFSIKTKKSGILRDVKKKRFYTKPSVQKKLDRMRSVRRQKKEERLAQIFRWKGLSVLHHDGGALAAGGHHLNPKP